MKNLFTPKDGNYVLHLLAFIFLIACLASCSTSKEVYERPIAERQYFFIKGQIVMVPHYEEPPTIIASK